MAKNSNYLFSEDTSDEIQEWLGITKADIIMLIAVGLVFATWVVQIKPVQIIFIVAVSILCYYSSKLGMKHNPKVSKLTNLLKKISYPISSIIIIGAAIAVVLNLFHF